MRGGAAFLSSDEGRSVCDGAALLNCLTYYQSELVPLLLRLQVLLIAFTLLSEPSARAAEALRELVRLVQALSCCEPRWSLRHSVKLKLSGGGPL